MNRPECDQVTDLLLAGERPADDSRLAAHAGSCLHCFRMAADLKDAPRIGRLLRQAQPNEAADPGDAFWAKFPATVTAAWQTSRGPAAPLPSAPWRSRLIDWISRPVPAALAGAAVAGLVMFVLPRSVAEPPVAVVAARPEEVAQEIQAGEGDHAEIEQNLGNLEEDDLQTLLADMDIDEDARAAPGPAATELEREPAVSVAEEMETLGAEDLQALQQALRKASRI